MSSVIEKKCSDMIRELIGDFFKEHISFKKVSDVVNEIQQRHRKLSDLPLEERDKQRGREATRIRNALFEVQHPIVYKKMRSHWDRVREGTDSANKLRETILEMLKKGVASTEDVERLEREMEEFKKEAMSKIEEVLFKKGDLRQTPGSVASTEAGNLYFGEKYDKEKVCRLSAWLLNSICIGQDIAVHFSNEDLQQGLRELLMRKYTSKHASLEKLKIHRVEGDKPFTVLTKFMLWLFTLVEDEECSSHVENLLRLLKETEGVVFVVPSKEEVEERDKGVAGRGRRRMEEREKVRKEREYVIPLPRLDFFVSRWLEIPERRKVLERMRDSLYSFMKKVEEKAGGWRAAENQLKLLSTYSEIFYAGLLRSSFADPEPLRRIVDLAIELSSAYEIGVDLSFVKELTSQVGGTWG